LYPTVTVHLDPVTTAPTGRCPTMTTHPSTMHRLHLTLITLPLVACLACQSKGTTGYADVPTVTPNVLSGVYTMSPNSPTCRLYYETAGQGDTLILLHGYGTDRRMWDKVFKPLSRNHYVVRYDLRGYGLSDVPEVGFGYLHADDLAALMDKLSIQKAHLVGVSLGGRVITEFTALYPERVHSATISSGALSHIPDRSSVPPEVVRIYNDTVFASNRLQAKENAARGMDALKAEWKQGMRRISGKRYRHIKDKLERMIDDWQAWQWVNPETDAFIGDQADSLLARQTQHPPMLLLIGQYDYTENKKAMHRLAALCPEASIQLLPEAGHFTVMESPKLFMKHLQDFLEKNSSPSTPQH